MAFPGAQAISYASKGTFNEVGRNQYNIQLAASPSHSSLIPAFHLASYISSIGQQTQASQRQIQALSAYIETLLITLDDGYRSGRLLESRTSVALDSLHEYVEIMTL
jgi:hypothetical protein